MKIIFVSALLMLLPVVAHAACTPTDFAIKEFKQTIAGSRLSLSGELVNNCTEPYAAQIRIEAKDASGGVVQSKQGWPAGTTNIAPGTSAKFDLGKQFRLQADMASYTVSVIAVRAW